MPEARPARPPHPSGLGCPPTLRWMPLPARLTKTSLGSSPSTQNSPPFRSEVGTAPRLPGFGATCASTRSQQALSRWAFAPALPENSAIHIDGRCVLALLLQPIGAAAVNQCVCCILALPQCCSETETRGFSGAGGESGSGSQQRPQAPGRAAPGREPRRRGSPAPGTGPTIAFHPTTGGGGGSSDSLGRAGSEGARRPPQGQGQGPRGAPRPEAPQPHPHAATNGTAAPPVQPRPGEACRDVTSSYLCDQITPGSHS